MDPIEIYKLSSNIENDPHRELTEINGKLMIRWKDRYTPLDNDRQYTAIKQCIEQRRNRKGLFDCRCGVCMRFLLGNLHDQLYLKPKKNDSDILEEALNECMISPNKENKNTVPVIAVKYDMIDPGKPVPVIAATFGSTPQYKSESPQSKPPVTQHIHDTCILTFGKHKDKTFKTVFDNDRPYCVWCIESVALEQVQGKTTSPIMSLFISYIKNRIYSL
jgi:hypothetical protein